MRWRCGDSVSATGCGPSTRPLRTRAVTATGTRTCGSSTSLRGARATRRCSRAERRSGAASRTSSTRASRSPPPSESAPHQDVAQPLALEVGNRAPVRRVTDGDQDVRPLVRRAIEDVAKEGHRTGRVRQSGEARRMQTREQETDRDPDGLADVVVLDLAAVGRDAVHLLEDDDDERRILDVRLSPVRPERPQGLEPLVWHPALVAPPLLLLRGSPDPTFQVRIRNDDEGPGLLMSAGRRRRGGRDRVLDDLVRGRLGREVSHTASQPHALPKGARTRDLLRFRETLELERDEARLLGHRRRVRPSLRYPKRLRPIRLAA